MSHGMREFLPWRTLDTDGFVKLIQNDFELINEKYSKSLIMSMNKKQFKKWIKSKIKKAAYLYLIKEKNSDTNKKIQHIQYKKLETQKYLKSAKFYKNQA